MAFLWAVHLVNAIGFAGHLSVFGIHPRIPLGLVGIVFAPFLHADVSHVLANCSGFLPLGLLVLFRGRRDFAVASLSGIFLGGLGTWLLGRDGSVHIGASGVIFAYFGYSLARGLFDRSVWSVLGSVLVGGAFGGMIVGVLPGEPGISWEGHASGLLSGIFAAWVLARVDRRQHEREPLAPRRARVK
jgi:membrane associated rhomboid family serine protease